MREAERGALPTRHGLWDAILKPGHPATAPSDQVCLAALAATVKEDSHITPYSYHRFMVAECRGSACTGGLVSGCSRSSPHLVACVAGFDPHTQGFAHMISSLERAVSTLHADVWQGGLDSLNKGWEATRCVGEVMPPEVDGEEPATTDGGGDGGSADGGGGGAVASDGAVASGGAGAGAGGCTASDDDACAAVGSGGAASAAAVSPPTAIHDPFTIEAVYTDPDHRRQGLAHHLLELQLARARKLGYKHAQILVHVNNTKAQLAYERSGFAEASRRVSPAFEALFGDPGFVCMRRKL